MLKTELKTKMQTTKTDDVLVLIFECKTANQPILERKQIDWIKCAVSDFTTKVALFDNSVQEIDQIKQNLTDSKYTIVLYSFNPLITKSNIRLCLDYLTLKQERLIKLAYGYIFETEYFKCLTQIKEPTIFSGDASEFLKIETAQEFEYATQVLQHRILHKLINDGVNIVNPANTIINAFVTVESGATIFPFNTLMGQTEISKNAILKEGNTISNSDIGQNSIIANSVISDSTICSDCVIFPFNTIQNGTFVGCNCTIKSYNKINNAKINDNTTIESFNDIG